MTRWTTAKPEVTILKGTIKTESAKAILMENIQEIDHIDAVDYVDDPNVLRSQWFPLSRILKRINGECLGEDVIHVESWICKKKGLVN